MGTHKHVEKRMRKLERLDYGQDWATHPQRLTGSRARSVATIDEEESRLRCAVKGGFKRDSVASEVKQWMLKLDTPGHQGSLCFAEFESTEQMYTFVTDYHQGDKRKRMTKIYA